MSQPVSVPYKLTHASRRNSLRSDYHHHQVAFQALPIVMSYLRVLLGTS
ncbi:MAG: hypothetical protein J6P29_05525 [Acetobacter sp.]|nr:hypothetical protein [Acetobacter sp.]